MDGVARLASENPDLKFVIEYKPREPRVKMSYDSVARTLLGIEKIGLPNIGILLDFGHAIYGGESAADSAQLAIDYGRLFGMDVNDNYRSWDDDLLAGSLHPLELFEFFYVLRKNNWEGVWQLDQFPFREDSVEVANMAIAFLKSVDKALDSLQNDGFIIIVNRHIQNNYKSSDYSHTVGTKLKTGYDIPHYSDLIFDELKAENENRGTAVQVIHKKDNV